MLLNGGQVCSPEDVWQNPEIFVATTRGCVCVCMHTNGILWVEARDAARHLNSSQGSCRELSDPHVSDTKVEKPVS